jgi:hypothetical protein
VTEVTAALDGPAPRSRGAPPRLRGSHACIHTRLVKAFVAVLLLCFAANVFAGTMHLHLQAVDDDGPAVASALDHDQGASHDDHGSDRSAAHCDVCGHTCGQPASIAPSSSAIIAHSIVSDVAPDVAVSDRPVPVPHEPPRA